MKASRMSSRQGQIPSKEGRPSVLMLLMNAYDPDPRVRQEALALIRMGCFVRILGWDRDLKAPASECMEGVAVERIFVRSAHGRGTSQLFFYIWVYLKMFWRVWKTPFDVVHCHDLDTLPIGFFLGKLKRKRIVFDSHENFTDMLEGSVHPSVRGALVRMENFMIRRIDLLITVGEKLRSHFAERGARHSVVVGNWKRPEEYARTPAQKLETRQQLGIPEGALVVVCITQLLRDRQIEELLDALDRCQDVYLIIGGKGVLENLVLESARRNPRIIYVGFASGEQISAYTCAADIVYYGFDPKNPNARFSAPNKLFEALAAGRPLITGDFGEIADVVRKAACGVVLDEYTADGIAGALSRLGNFELREQMASNARRYGLGSMSWQKGEEILHREYATLVPAGLQCASARMRDAGVGVR